MRRERHVSRHLIGREVDVRRQMPDDAIGVDGDGGRLDRAARDDERNPRLVQQDRVGFVDHRDGKWPQDLLVGMEREPVTQIVEPQLIGGRVGDVAPIGRASFLRRHILRHGPHGQAEPAVCLTHPLRIAAGEIVVRGQHVDAISCARVPRDGGNRCQRLALTGLHLRQSVRARARERLRVVRRTSAARAPATPRQQ